MIPLQEGSKIDPVWIGLREKGLLGKRRKDVEKQVVLARVKRALANKAVLMWKGGRRFQQEER